MMGGSSSESAAELVVEMAKRDAQRVEQLVKMASITFPARRRVLPGDTGKLEIVAVRRDFDPFAPLGGKVE